MAGQRTEVRAERDGEVSAAVAALRLGMARDRVIRRIQTRELVGRFDRGWLVSVASIEAFEQRATSRRQNSQPVNVA